jgi:hypothetical protein
LSEGSRRHDTGEPKSLEILTEALQRRLTTEAQASGRKPPPREETVFIVRLVATAMLGDALMGDMLNRLSGHPGDAAHQRRFRRWLAQVLEDRFNAQTAPKRRS